MRAYEEVESPASPVSNVVAYSVTLQFPVDKAILTGDLDIPAKARGLVLFAHGSGSGRHSFRNRHVAQLLNEAKLATLLIDLLTANEEAIDLHTGHLRFDIELLARRLVSATDWLTQRADRVTFRLATLAPAPALPLH